MLIICFLILIGSFILPKITLPFICFDTKPSETNELFGEHLLKVYFIEKENEKNKISNYRF